MLAVMLAVGVAACVGDDGGSTTSAVSTTTTDAEPGSGPTTEASTTTTTIQAPTTTTSTTTKTSPVASTVPPTVSAACPLPDDGIHPIMSGGVERSYLTRRPATLSPGRVPVVVLLHGFNGSAEEFSARSGVADRAAASGVLLVAPQGQGQPAGWEIPNWVTDAQFVNDVLDDVGATGCAMTDAVWVGGHSAGSAFAAYYGCTNTDRVAGIWLNAGLPPPLCTDRSPAVVISHGTADPVVPFGGGDQQASDRSFVLKPVPESAQEWATAAGCRWVERPVGSAQLGIMTWQGCSTGSYVRLYTIEGGGHTWPGAVSETGIGETTVELDATCLLVESARIGAGPPVDPVTCQ
jgi:polyhydroxybutyrate depolymerase